MPTDRRGWCGRGWWRAGKQAFQLLEHEENKKAENGKDLWTLAQAGGQPPLFLGSANAVGGGAGWCDEQR